MAINEWLAEVYGTNGSGSDNDLEKTAQAMMLQKLAEEEGVDLSGLDEEQLNALAQEIVQNAEVIEAATSGGEGEGEPPAVEPNPAAEEEEAQAKFAEADFLGRVMAHSYTQELNKIAEEAAAAEEEEEKKETKKKEEEEEGEKTAGPLTSAIRKLGGTVGTSKNAAAYIEKLAEARAEEMAVGWLRQNGYIK